MESIDIKGKAYITVNERLKEFHRLYPNGSIKSTIVSNDNGICVFRSTIRPDVDKESRVFIAHAYEQEGSTFINKTSHIENCETSAVGRALGMLGIGINTSVASADEVQNAMANQKDDNPLSEKQMGTVVDYINNLSVDSEKFCKYMKVDSLDDIQQSQYKKAISALQAKENK